MAYRIEMARRCAIAAAIAVGSIAAVAKSEAPPPVKIVLHPAPEAWPALKYHLLPPLLDRRAGNAAVHYLKIPHEQTPLFSDRKFWDTISAWAETPLVELRRQAAGPEKQYAWIEGPSSIFEMLERGGRCESCDWDIPIHEHEYYSILLPDIQSTRSAGRILAARARLQIAHRHFDDAIHTMQTGFALARNVANGPTLIMGLVGVTIGTQMADQAETLLQQPDSPNLYWALATLPRPFIDFRPGFEAEFASIYLTYPELRNIDKKDLSAEEWRRLLQKLLSDERKLFYLSGGGSSNPDLIGVVDELRLLEGYPRAKKYLIAHGYTPQDVEAMPAPKAILLFTMAIYEELRDDTFRSMEIPFPEARKGMADAEKRLKKAVGDGIEIIPLASMLLPAVNKVKEAEARMAQKIAAVQILEALRIYAFGHDGRLPQTLGDITEVPVPADPFTNEPFHYVREGDTAKLESAYPSAAPLRYEIKIEGGK